MSRIANEQVQATGSTAQPTEGERGLPFALIPRHRQLNWVSRWLTYAPTAASAPFGMGLLAPAAVNAGCAEGLPREAAGVLLLRDPGFGFGIWVYLVTKPWHFRHSVGAN